MKSKAWFGFIMFALGSLSIADLGLIAVVALQGNTGAGGPGGGSGLGDALAQVGGAAGDAARSDAFWSAVGVFVTLFSAGFVGNRARARSEQSRITFDLTEHPVEAEELEPVRLEDVSAPGAPDGVESPASLLQKGLAEKDPGRSLDLLHQAAYADPMYPPAMFNLAAALYNRRKYPDALAEANRLLTVSRIAPYLNLKAKILRAMHQAQEALAVSIQACESGGRGNVWHTRGLIHSDLHQDEAALLAFEQALRLAPGNAEAWSDKGDALLRLKRYPAALEAYDEYLKREHDPKALVKRSRVLYHLKRYQEALTSVEQALAENPGLAVAHRVRADILRAQGQRKAARKEKAEAKLWEQTSKVAVKAAA